MKRVPFKIVATDMDGTFYNENSSYDKHEFQKIMQLFHKNKLHFVIATGNELMRTRHDMDRWANQCDYVCENGSLVAIGDKIIYQNPLPLTIKNAAIVFLQNEYPDTEIVLSGQKCAYVLKNAKTKFKQMVHFCYAQVDEVSDLLQVVDPIFKITVNCSEKLVKEIIVKFNNTSKKIRGVTGGGEWMDLVQPDASKGSGLKVLLDYLKLTSDQLLAFGDGNNDLEMLKLARYSYAMTNGTPETKKAARFIAPANTDNGVFRVLEKYLGEINEQN